MLNTTIMTRTVEKWVVSAVKRNVMAIGEYR